MFDHQAVFHVTKKADADIEELLLELIDYGVEDIDEDEGELVISGDFASNAAIQSHLEELGYEITSSEFVRVPMDYKQLSPEEREDVEKLLEKLEEDEDVQNVFHNMAEEE